MCFLFLYLWESFFHHLSVIIYITTPSKLTLSEKNQITMWFFFSLRRTLLRQGRQWMINIIHSFCLSYWYDMTPWMRMTGFLGGTDMNRGKQAMVIKTYHLYQYLIGSASGREEPQTCILSWLNKRLLRAPSSTWVELYQAQSHSQTLKLSFSENMISMSQVPNTSLTRHLSLVTSPSLLCGITLHFKN